MVSLTITEDGVFVDRSITSHAILVTVVPTDAK